MHGALWSERVRVGLVDMLKVWSAEIDCLVIPEPLHNALLLIYSINIKIITTTHTHALLVILFCYNFAS